MIEGLKPYPAMKDSRVRWLGEVPEHWEVQRLGSSVLGCINGIWGGEPDGLHDLPCVRVADFDRTRLRVRLTDPTLRAITRSERNRRLLKAGDLLLEKSGGGDLQPVGVVMLYDHAASAVCSNFVARLPVAAGFESAYLTYLHSHLYAIRLNVRSIKQTTGIQNLDSSSYLAEPVAFPPFSEQAAIVRFLDHADRRIRRYIRAKQRLIKLLEEQKQAIIHRAVTRGLPAEAAAKAGLDPNVRLKPSRVEWLGEVPEHWEVRRVKQAAQILRGKFTHRPRNDQSLYDGPYPFIQTGEVARAEKSVTVYRQTLNERGLAVSKMFPAGTLVMTIAANIGDVAVLDFEACFPDSIVGFVPRSVVERGYLYYVFRAMKSELLREAPVNTQGNLNVDRIGSRGIPLPPVAEQQVIVQHIEEGTLGLNAATDRARREIDLLREYRTRLIADVVTGKLDVRTAAARLPDESDGPEPLDESEAERDAQEADADDTDEVREEAEA